jgi:hypothetical protein
VWSKNSLTPQKIFFSEYFVIKKRIVKKIKKKIARIREHAFRRGGPADYQLIPIKGDGSIDLHSYSSLVIAFTE